MNLIINIRELRYESDFEAIGRVLLNEEGGLLEGGEDELAGNLSLAFRGPLWGQLL